VNLWNLLPGSDLNINDTLINNSSTTTITGASPSMVLKGGQAVTVFILGSSFDSTSQLYDGPVQDLTATSGFIRVSN
jgi:hypothetical protein